MAAWSRSLTSAGAVPADCRWSEVASGPARSPADWPKLRDRLAELLDVAEVDDPAAARARLDEQGISLPTKPRRRGT